MTPDKLSIVVFSGDFERVHYALATAAAAAAVDRPTTLFFTMEAIHALARRRGDGTPGWTALEGAATRDAADVGAMTHPYLHEPDYFELDSLQDSLAGCLPRVDRWVLEFLAEVDARQQCPADPDPAAVVLRA